MRDDNVVMLSSSAILLGLILIGIEVAREVPAWWRVRKVGSVDGLSAASLGVLTGSSMVWLILPVLYQGWWLLASTVVWVVFHLLLWFEFLRYCSGTQKRTTLMWAIASSSVSAVGLFIGWLVAGSDGVLLVGTVIMGAATVSYAFPALWTGMTSKTTRGMSWVNLSVNAIDGLAYVVAGFALIEGFLGVGGFAWAYVMYALLR